MNSASPFVHGCPSVVRAVWWLCLSMSLPACGGGGGSGDAGPREVSVDMGSDAIGDTRADVDLDAAPDVRQDAADDAITDAALDSGPPDAQLDAPADLASDTSTDLAPVDAASDSASDTLGPPPVNDSCSTAMVLTLSASGAAGATGDTTNATDSVKLSSSGCTKSGSSGRDLFYAVTLTAGKTYQITATPAAGFDSMIYVFTSCGSPGATCVAGKDTMGGGKVDKILLSPAATATYHIAVDAYATPEVGTFALAVKEVSIPTNDTCSAAAAMTWSSGGAAAAGDSSLATDSINLSAGGCTGHDTEGADLFYEVPVTAGVKYKVNLVPAGFNAALYLLSSCTNPTGTCVAGSDSGYSGDSESVTFTAAATGDQLIAVDSRHAASSGYAQGPFKLTIEAGATPTHDSCASPAALTWVGQKATASGSTSFATGTLNLTAACTGFDTEGQDVFYSVQLKAGKAYKVTLSPSSSFDGAVYVLDACAGVTGCVEGDDAGVEGEQETLLFKPPTTGTYIIGVDSEFKPAEAFSSGTFSLDLQETTLPGNDACAAAAAMVLDSGGVATASGDTSAATNAVTLSGASCAGYFSPGRDLFYSVQLAAGKSYTVTLTPGASFDAMLYAFTSCGAPETSCVGGSDSVGGGAAEKITLSPTTTTTYTIGVDSYDHGESGAFTLEVK